MPKKNEKEKKTPIELVVCSQCRGEGINENRAQCSTCQGLGVFLRVGKNGIYYWQEKLLGVSPALRSLYQILPKAIIISLYFLIFITLSYGIYFVIVNNPDFLKLVRKDFVYGSSESIMESWFFMIYIISYRLLEALLVLVEKKGMGPLMFWAAISGAAYVYYYIKTKNASRKENKLSSH